MPGQRGGPRIRTAGDRRVRTDAEPCIRGVSRCADRAVARIHLELRSLSSPRGGAATPATPAVPSELSTETTLPSGLVLTASGTIASTEPTVIRVTAALSNPTDHDVTMGVGARECRVIAVAYWEAVPGGRAVAPPDGYLGPTQPSACRGVANGFQITVEVGETLMLPDTPVEFTLSAVLAELEGEFVPGRFVIGALILSDFEYEVLALDTVIDN